MVKKRKNFSIDADLLQKLKHKAVEFNLTDEEDEGELIAVITAALKMAMAQEAPPDTGSGKAAEPVFIVKSVKRRR